MATKVELCKKNERDLLWNSSTFWDPPVHLGHAVGPGSASQPSHSSRLDTEYTTGYEPHSSLVSVKLKVLLIRGGSSSWSFTHPCSYPLFFPCHSLAGQYNHQKKKICTDHGWWDTGGLSFPLRWSLQYIGSTLSWSLILIASCDQLIHYHFTERWKTSGWEKILRGVSNNSPGSGDFHRWDFNIVRAITHLNERLFSSS